MVEFIICYTTNRMVIYICRSSKSRNCKPKQNVYINVPQELMGSVTGEMSQRRAEIAGMETEGDMAVITAKAPVKEMFGFASEIRSATGGRALWSTEFAGYEAEIIYNSNVFVVQFQIS